MPNNYGDVGPYGADNPYGGSTGGHSGSCVCGDVWRFEATDLRTGRVKAVLHPLGVTFETNLSKPGQGQITVATREYVAAQIWPHTTGLFISRVHTGLDSSQITRECVFGGYINEYRGSSGGATTLGLVTIDEYLNHRHIADADSGLAYTATAKDQNLICAELVAYAHWNGIPLTAINLPSDYLRDRSWQAWEVKNIGNAIAELVSEPNGPMYEPVHSYGSGYWSTQLRFADTIGTDRNIKLKSDVHGFEYQVAVDGKDHTTRAYGIGQGEEAAQLMIVAYDAAADGIGYPEFHATPAWKDTPDLSTLQGLTMGHIVNFRDPVTTPGMSVAGMDPEPSVTVNGDRVEVDIAYGLVAFEGYAKIVSQAWEFTTNEPIIRTFGFQPETRPAVSVRTMTVIPPPAPAQPTPTADPQAGLVSRITDTRITESSGMAHSKKW